MSMIDETTYRLCESGPPGDTPAPKDRLNRRRAAQKLSGWLEQNGHNYQSASAAKSDACQFVLTTLVLGAVITAVIEWVVERVLSRWFGE